MVITILVSRMGRQLVYNGNYNFGVTNFVFWRGLKFSYLIRRYLIRSFVVALRDVEGGDLRCRNTTGPMVSRDAEFTRDFCKEE